MTGAETLTPAAVWARVLAGVQPDWLPQIRANAVQAEARRARATYNTGTISEAACLYLWALTAWLQPKIAVEFGTFIGSSAMAIQAKRVYTCDKSNDCMPSSDRIICHPRKRSGAMLRQMVDRGVRAGFFFFDGRIAETDLPLILRASTLSAVYAFDDYEGQEKGVINVDRLRPVLGSDYVLMPPPPQVLDLPSQTTIAVLMPASRWPQ